MRNLGDVTQTALAARVGHRGTIPEPQHTYSMADDELEDFEADVAATSARRRGAE